MNTKQLRNVIALARNGLTLIAQDGRNGAAVIAELAGDIVAVEAHLAALSEKQPAEMPKE